MRTNRKMEEKKMSMSKNIARLAVTAGLTAALSFGGVMAPVTMAFAAGDQGSITIHKVDDKNAGNTFKAYQIFKAKVVDEGSKGKVASDIKWANDDIDSKVITAIKGSTQYQKLVDEDSTKALANDAAAPVVAEWLSQNVKGTAASTVSSSEGTRVAPGDVLYEIAAAVSGMKQNVKEETAAGQLTADESWTRPNPNENHGLYGDGYYLFVSDGLTDPAKPNTGTSPIFAIVGGDPVVVTEKTSIPTVTKKVRDDKSTSVWADKADSQMGQDVQYQLTGTVADNIATFGTYYYEFHDELSAGLAADLDSVEVKVNDTPVLKNTTVNAVTGYDAAIDGETNTLTVKFANLKAAAERAGVTLNEQSEVVVTYKAKLDPNKVENVTVGGEGNLNTVRLIYSNNPMSADKGESVPDTVRDYTYALKLVKKDHESKNKLENVGFTIQATNPDDNADGSASKGKYVQELGNLGETPYEFFTDENGEIYIKGLDAGTYTVHEQTALGNYNSLKDFTFTISTQASGVDSLHKTEEEAQTVTVTRTAETSDLVILDDATQTDGTVTLTVENKKGSNLPLTGLNGVTFTWIAGGAVLVIGVAHLIRSRKQAEESEQE